MSVGAIGAQSISDRSSSRLDLIKSLRRGNRIRPGKIAADQNGGRATEYRQASVKTAVSARTSDLSTPSFRITQATGFGASSTATSDSNGDGKLVWAIAMSGDNTVWVYFGNGDRTWQMPR